MDRPDQSDKSDEDQDNQSSCSPFAISAWVGFGLMYSIVCPRIDQLGAVIVHGSLADCSPEETERNPTEPHEVGNQHGSYALKPQVGDQSVDADDQTQKEQAHKQTQGESVEANPES